MSTTPPSTDLATALSASDLEELVAEVVAEIQSPGLLRPRLVRVHWADRDWVIKDYRECWWIVRQLTGPFQAWRERRAYRRLKGLRGIPELLEVPHRAVLAIEFVEGEVLRHGLVDDPERLLAELDELVAQMHERGVVHLDMRSKSNILVDPDGHPWLIDFGSAALLANTLLIGRILRAVDRGAVVKNQRRIAPGTLRPEQLSQLEKQDRMSCFSPRLTRLFQRGPRRRDRPRKEDRSRDAAGDLNADSTRRP